MSRLPGVINGYDFKKVLGRGGYSTVYLVESKKYKQVYVAKVTPITKDSHKDGGIDSIEAEITALMSLSHKNIIKLYDHFTSGQNFYMILEYCPGGSLQSDSPKFSGLKKCLFVSFAKQILEALAFCHMKNIAHRDIKPGNILIDGNGYIKVSDFGISMANVSNEVQAYTGSLLYEPPEIVLKKPHNPMQADIWSTGVLFAYLINGITPWRCDNISLLKQRICAGRYKLRSSTPPEIASLIKKMIIVDPSERATAEELLKEKIFEEIEGSRKTDCEQMELINLSLKLRERNKTTCTQLHEFKRIKSNSINIFKMKLINGDSNLPKLKARYHEERDEPFVINNSSSFLGY